jgi:hypothetical protein
VIQENQEVEIDTTKAKVSVPFEFDRIDRDYWYWRFLDRDYPAIDCDFAVAELIPTRLAVVEKMRTETRPSRTPILPFVLVVELFYLFYHRYRYHSQQASGEWLPTGSERRGIDRSCSMLQCFNGCNVEGQYAHSMVEMSSWHHVLHVLGSSI